MKKTIQESLQHINDAVDPAAALLEYEYDSVFLKYLRIAFAVDYKFSPDLGVGYPEHVRLNRDFPDGISDSALRTEHRQFYLYQDITNLDIKRRMFQFGGMLEVIHYKEADLIIAIKDGKFNVSYPNVTYELAASVYPDIFPQREGELIIELITEPDEEVVPVVKARIPPLEVAKPITIPEEKVDRRSKAYRDANRPK